MLVSRLVDLSDLLDLLDLLTGPVKVDLMLAGVRCEAEFLGIASSDEQGRISATWLVLESPLVVCNLCINVLQLLAAEEKATGDQRWRYPSERCSFPQSRGGLRETQSTGA